MIEVPHHRAQEKEEENGQKRGHHQGAARTPPHWRDGGSLGKISRRERRPFGPGRADAALFSLGQENEGGDQGVDFMDGVHEESPPCCPHGAPVRYKFVIRVRQRSAGSISPRAARAERSSALTNGYLAGS
ncbi:MAG: hypothetical protein H0X34_06225 [Chthoniobacterales bacterium]|nr:hypothetical protein [Chthoniobacterales bacterium]